MLLSRIIYTKSRKHKKLVGKRDVISIIRRYMSELQKQFGKSQTEYIYSYCISISSFKLNSIPIFSIRKTFKKNYLLKLQYYRLDVNKLFSHSQKKSKINIILIHFKKNVKCNKKELLTYSRQQSTFSLILNKVRRVVARFIQSPR